VALVDDLKTARDQLVARIVEITASPKPSYTVDGQTVSWTAYLKELREGLRQLEEEIRRAEGPFEVRTQGFT